MRSFLVACAPVIALGCRGASGDRDAVRADDAPPVSISITLDRATIAATDELTGTIHVEFRTPREPGEGAKAWCAITTWRLELANETAPLLDLVVEGEDEGTAGYAIPLSKRSSDYRFKVVPCAALAERSRASAVPLRLFDPGNHALRLVLDARDPGGWSMASMGASYGAPLVPLNGTFASRWSTLDVVAAGRPLDADDLEAIALADENHAGVVFTAFGMRILGADRMAAMVARATGTTRGELAQAFVRTVPGRGEWWDLEAWSTFESAFTEVGDARLDCPSHDAPPFFARLPFGRAIPIRNASSEAHNFKLQWVEGGFVTSNHALMPGRSLDAGSLFPTRGLYRAKCDMHPQVWGWLLVE